jgi:hypothetical protein
MYCVLASDLMPDKLHWPEQLSAIEQWREAQKSALAAAAAAGKKGAPARGSTPTRKTSDGAATVASKPATDGKAAEGVTTQSGTVHANGDSAQAAATATAHADGATLVTGEAAGEDSGAPAAVATAAAAAPPPPASGSNTDVGPPSVQPADLDFETAAPGGSHVLPELFSIRCSHVLKCS